MKAGPVLIALVFVLMLAAVVYADHYYVDIEEGVDSHANGSQANPLKTFALCAFRLFWICY